MAAGLQREIIAHQVWLGNELVISNVHSQLCVALSSNEAERVALEVPLLTEFEHMNLGADDDGSATAWAESERVGLAMFKPEQLTAPIVSGPLTWDEVKLTLSPRTMSRPHYMESYRTLGYPREQYSKMMEVVEAREAREAAARPSSSASSLPRSDGPVMRSWVPYDGDSEFVYEHGGPTRAASIVTKRLELLIRVTITGSSGLVRVRGHVKSML